MAPWTRRALEILADGRWHDADWVLTEAARTVEPARAFRVAETSRRESWERSRAKGKAGPWRERAKSQYQHAIDAGARQVAYDSLVKLRGLEWRQQPDGTRQLRDTEVLAGPPGPPAPAPPPPDWRAELLAAGLPLETAAQQRIPYPAPDP
jgi:hypothetical protein